MLPDWNQALPASLRAAAFTLPTTELGFPPERALEAVASGRTTGLACLGGDEWRRLGSGQLEPTLRNWFVKRGAGESDNAFTARSWDEADSFVREHACSDSVIVFVVGDCCDPPQIV